MKKIPFCLIFTLLLSLVVFSFTYKNSLDCSKIKNGKYYYYTKKLRERVEIERLDSLQTETNTRNGQVSKSKIIWKADCKFEMYINAFSNFKLDKGDSLLSVTAALVEILKLEPQYYVSRLKLRILNTDIEATDTIYFKMAH